MVVDGPRGPSRESKPGAVWISQQVHLPIVSVSARANAAVRLRNWDQTLIPMPFARVSLKVSPAFYPNHSRELDERMRENDLWGFDLAKRTENAEKRIFHAN